MSCSGGAATVAAAEGEEVNGKAADTELPAAAAAAAPEGTAKCRKRKRRLNRRKRIREVAANAKGNGMVEEEETVSATAAVLTLKGTPELKEEGKAKEMVMTGQEEEATATAAVSDSEGTVKCKKKKKKKAKETTVDELVAPIVIPVLALEGTEEHDVNGENGNETGLAEEETSTAVSASEGPRKHRRKKNKMQKQQESTLTLSGLVAVDVANKLGNGGANGEEASGDADVSMDPINMEDPCFSEAKEADVKVNCESQEGDKNCTEKFCLFQEGSEDSKREPNREKRKRKRDVSCDIFPQDEETDSNPGLDSSCLVPAHEEKVNNIFSPRGSLIRFKRKKLLILDLNGLLADITMDRENEHLAHAKVKGKLVFRRPYYDDFLRFCFQHFELGIWSSRKMENVNSVVDILMQDLKRYLLFCWDMSKCTFTGCKVIGERHKPLVLKELKKLWNKEDPYLPWQQGEFSPSNTLLVDDSPYKALCNPPHTAIFPQPYSYLNQRNDYSLGPGGDLRVYLERLAAADDVQVFVQDNPFGQPSITESDPKWGFYAKIVRRVEQGLSLSWH